MPPSTLIESAVYSLLPLLTSSAALIGVTFPSFVLASTMGVLISLVAIPLRENVPNFFWNSLLLEPGNRLETRPDPAHPKARDTGFKLLKLQILKTISEYLNYTINEATSSAHPAGLHR